MLALCFRLWLTSGPAVRPAGTCFAKQVVASASGQDSRSRCFAASAGGLPKQTPSDESGKPKGTPSSTSSASERQPPPSAEALAKKAASRAFQRLTTPPDTLKKRGEAVEDEPVQTAVKWGKGKVTGTVKDKIRNPLLLRLGLGFGVLLPAAGVYFSGKAILGDVRRLSGIAHAAAAASASPSASASGLASADAHSEDASSGSSSSNSSNRHASASDASAGKASQQEVRPPRSRRAVAAYAVAAAADVALAGAAVAGLAKAIREHTASAAAQVTGVQATAPASHAAADSAAAAAAHAQAAPMVADAADAVSLAAEAAAVAPESPTHAAAALHWAAHYWEGALGMPAAAAPALALLATAASLSGQVWEEHGSARAALRAWLPRTAPRGERLVADVAAGRTPPADAAAQAAKLADAALEEAAPDLTAAPDAAPALGTAVGETPVVEKLRKVGSAAADKLRPADPRVANAVGAVAANAAETVHEKLRTTAQSLEGAARDAALKDATSSSTSAKE